MTWFTFALLAGLSVGASRITARFLLRNQGNPLAFTALVDGIAGLFLLPFAFSGSTGHVSAGVWILFISMVIFALLSDWTSYAALRIYPLSEYQLLQQLRHPLMLFGGFLVFAEAVTPMKVIGVVLITIGCVLAVFERGRINMNKGAVLTILSTIAAVIAFHFSKQIAGGGSVLFFASIELLLIGAISFALLRGNIQILVAEFKQHPYGIILTAAAFAGFEGWLFLALERGEASRVIPVTQIGLPLTILVGILWLGERNRLAQKITGTILAIIGILVLYLV